MKTKQEQLGFVFENSMPSFDPDKRATMIDVVRVWMYKYDEKRGDTTKISSKIKDSIIGLILTFFTLKRRQYYMCFSKMNFFSTHKALS